MVNKTQAETVFGDWSNQDMPLIEILYADAGIIDSLAAMLEDSQHPDRPEPERRPSRARPSHRQMDAGLLIDPMDTAPKSTAPPKEPEEGPSTPSLEKHGDARLAAVLRSLKIPKTKGTVLPSSERSLLVHLDGQLQYFSKRSYEKIMRRETGLKLLLDQPDARADADQVAVNLESLGLEPASLGEDDLSGYADTVGGAVLAFLPSGPGFILTLRGSKRPFYIPTLRKNLRYSPKRLKVLFPSFQLGNWKIVAYYPAAVKNASAKPEPKEAPTLLGTMNGMMQKQSEILAACGFPTERLQPILIYRDVSIANI